MPKSSRDRIAQLRSELLVLSRGMCEWPFCRWPGEQMAHIRGKGMGGSAEADTIDNVAWLCVLHHDVLDGRGPSVEWTTTQLVPLGIQYEPGKPGTKFKVRTALAKHINMMRTPQGGGGFSDHHSHSVEGDEKGW